MTMGRQIVSTEYNNIIDDRLIRFSKFLMTAVQ